MGRPDVERRARDQRQLGRHLGRRNADYRDRVGGGDSDSVPDITRVSLAGTVDDLRGLRPGRNIRVKPYALGSSHTVGRARTDGDFDAGLDVKYGVTSGLTWDFTVNTDFSQAEADEQHINLSRFNLFFPEKRDFFS